MNGNAPPVTGGIRMHAPIDNIPPARPLVIRILVRPRAYRHPRLFGGLASAAGAWLVLLGIILCSFGFWWGAALAGVGGLELWVAYHLLVAPLPQRVRELEQSSPRRRP